MTASEILSELNSHWCTDHWHPHPDTGFLMTDGVLAFIRLCGGQPIVDTIMLNQIHPRLLDARRLDRFQVWRITKLDDSMVLLTCHEDWDEKDHDAFPPVQRWEVKAPGFPLPEFRLWMESRVLILPSEH